MRTIVLAVAVGAIIVTAARSATADEPSDRDRVLHAAAISAGSASYLIVQFGFARQLAAKSCRWCDPPRLDSWGRDTLVWDDRGRADTLSSIAGYAIAPVAVLGLTAYGSGFKTPWRRRFDDVVPVIESVIAVSLIHHVAKFAIGRQRPYAHYATAGTLSPNQEDNVSFFSGHTSLAFGLAVSAGQVSTLRGYAIAPGVWTLGLALAATTGYLRIAADRHYTTDVLTGAAVGSAIGYLWPRFITRYVHGDSVTIVPQPTGLAVLGTF